MRRKSALILISIILIAALYFSARSTVKERIEQSIAARLPSMIGPAESYKVKVSGSPLDIARGHVDSLNISGVNVQLPKKICVDKLHIALKGISFRRDKTITNADSTRFSVSMSEKKLSNYLASARPDIPNPKVTLSGGRVTLSVSPDLPVDANISGNGNLRIVDGTKLYLMLDRIDAEGLNIGARGLKIPGFVQGIVQKDLNPILDLGKLGIGAKLSSASVEDGSLTLKGSADITKIMRR